MHAVDLVVLAIAAVYATVVAIWLNRPRNHRDD